NKRVDGLEKAIRTLGKAFATFAGLSKAADELDEKNDEDEDDTASKANQQAAPANSAGARKDAPGAVEVTEDELSATEKAALEGNIASKSMQQIFAEMHQDALGFSRDTRRPGLATPPDMSGRSAIVKSRVQTGPTDDEISQMTPTDAVEALCE